MLNFFILLSEQSLLYFGNFTILGILSYFAGLSFYEYSLLSLFCVPTVSYVICRAFGPRHIASSSEYNKTNGLLLLTFITASIFLTLCLNRPDADDQWYLGLSVLFLDHLHLPLQLLPIKPYIFPIHEYSTSLLSLITKAPLLLIYYLCIPAFWAAIAVIFQYRILQYLVGDRWKVGLFVFFIIMLTWGDVHRTPANFGLVRMFQGKACLVTIIIPAILYYYFKYVSNRKPWNAIMLFYCVLSGIGFTPTAIIVCPLLLLVLLVSDVCLNMSQLRRSLCIALVCVVPVILGYFYLYSNLSGIHVESHKVHTARGLVDATTTYEMIKFSLGTGFRGWFALVCLVVSPFCISNTLIRDKFRNFIVVCGILLAIPYTSEYIAKFTYPTSSWRWLWIIPFTLCISIVMSMVLRISFKVGTFNIGGIVISILLIIYVGSSERLVLSEQNYTKIGLPGAKIPQRKTFYLRNYGAFASVQGYRLFLKKENSKISIKEPGSDLVTTYYGRGNRLF